MKLLKKNNLFLLLPILIIICFNFQALTAFFSQDDFFHLRVIQQKTFFDIPTFFLTKQGEAGFYRPLSRETFDLITYQLFGLNPLAFHIINLLLIFLCGWLLFLITLKITHKRPPAFLALIVFSLSSIHNVELYYLASVQTLMATFFMLLGIYFYLKRQNFDKNYFLAFLSFILAICCHEISIIFVPVIFLIDIFLSKVNFKFKVTQILPFVLILGVYLFLTKSGVGLPSQLVYTPVFNLKSILNSFVWFTLWCFNLSEILPDFIGPKLSLNPNLVRFYPIYVYLVGSLFVVMISGLSILFFKLRKSFGKHFLLFVSIFTVAILPNTIFPQHKFIYYLSFANIWFCAIIGLILFLSWKNLANKVLVIIFLICFSVISISTISLNKITYWAAKRADAAKFITSDIKKFYPNLNPYEAIYIVNDPNYPNISKEWGSSSKQAFYILSGPDAFKLIYKNPNLKTYFEDVGGLPKDIPSTQVKYYQAKFPY